jgi:SUN domain-containing protein 1/2
MIDHWPTLSPFPSGPSTMDETRIKALVQSALLLYAADKTGRADFALETAGGSILSTRCSETYTSRSAMITLLGFPVW